MVELQTMNNSETYEKLLSSKWTGSVVTHSEDKINMRLHNNEIPALTRYLVDMNVDITSLHSRYSLEDYFLSLTTANQHVETFKN